MTKSPQWNRRSVLKALAASGSVALPACDQLNVEIKSKPDAVLYDEEGRPYIPEITSNENFYKYTCCGRPDFKPEDWELKIMDRGDIVARLDKPYLDTLDVQEIELTLECIGSGPRSQRINNAIWGGAPLMEVIEGLGVPAPHPSIVEIRMLGMDGYDASLPLSTVEGAPIWLVWRMNGEPLPDSHGYPARLMVPDRYGIKNIKWIEEIEFLDEIYEGYWDQFGWDHQGLYKVNGYILVPADQSENEGPIHVLGTAFAGSDPVVKVEVSTGFDIWKEAEFDYAPGPDRWVLWRYFFDPDQPGEYDITCRVTTESGEVTQGIKGTSPKAGYDGGQKITITVI